MARRPRHGQPEQVGVGSVGSAVERRASSGRAHPGTCSPSLHRTRMTAMLRLANEEMQPSVRRACSHTTSAEASSPDRSDPRDPAMIVERDRLAERCLSSNGQLNRRSVRVVLVSWVAVTWPDKSGLRRVRRHVMDSISGLALARTDRRPLWPRGDRTYRRLPGGRVSLSSGVLWRHRRRHQPPPAPARDRREPRLGGNRQRLTRSDRRSPPDVVGSGAKAWRD
jgi:hypothetical protein